MLEFAASGVASQVCILLAPDNGVSTSTSQNPEEKEMILLTWVIGGDFTIYKGVFSV